MPFGSGWQAKAKRQPLGGHLAAVVAADGLLLRPDHQADVAEAGVGRGREHVIEKRPSPADGDHGLDAGVGGGRLPAVERRRASSRRMRVPSPRASTTTLSIAGVGIRANINGANVHSPFGGWIPQSSDVAPCPSPKR